MKPPSIQDLQVSKSAPWSRCKAIAALNEVDMDGKTLSVSVARPREERPRRSYGNNGGGGYRGGNNSRGGGYGGSRGDNGYGGGRNRY